MTEPKSNKLKAKFITSYNWKLWVKQISGEIVSKDSDLSLSLNSALNSAAFSSLDQTSCVGSMLNAASCGFTPNQFHN